MANFEFKKGRSTIVGNQMDDVENADARTVLKAFHVRSITPAMVRFFEAKLGWLPFNLFAGINRQANEMTEALLTEIENKPLPPQIIQLLEQDLKKKEQVSLLKGVSLNKEQIGTLFLQAGKRGYKFSSYRFEGKPKQFDEKELPSFIYLRDNGDVEFGGETNLTKGQMKDLVLSSDFLVSRILDNGKHWHCFFQNAKSLQGKEGGKFGSQPHLHYISDSFGIAKEDLVKSVKSGSYPHTPVHILLTE